MAVCPPVSASVCHKPVLYQKDWTNRVGIWYEGFHEGHPTLCYEEILVCLKIRAFDLELFPKLWSEEKIFRRQVYSVVSKTHQRSSLLTTLATVDFPRLDVDLIYSPHSQLTRRPSTVNS